jgi:hypothetical protein
MDMRRGDEDLADAVAARDDLSRRTAQPSELIAV